MDSRHGPKTKPAGLPLGVIIARLAAPLSAQRLVERRASARPLEL